jgi:hypothetical protein
MAERADVWFELHRWEPGQPWFSPEYVSFLQRFRGKVITGGPIPEIQNHEVYPIERVEAEFSSYFLFSSLSLMSAMAILQIEDHRRARAHWAKRGNKIDDALTIHLAECLRITPTAQHETLEQDNKDDVIGYWGVDMAANEEYHDQRSGCHFFILEAMRRGIGVYVPQESCILRPKPVYGISEWDHSYIKATQRARELNAKKANLDQQAREATKGADFMAGALDNHNYWINTWTSPYGIPSGLVINHEPGTGLGGGITLPRPFSPPPDNVIDAAATADVRAGIRLPDNWIPTPPTPKKKRQGTKAAKRRK